MLFIAFPFSCGDSEYVTVLFARHTLPCRAAYSKREKHVLNQIVKHVLIPGISSPYLPSFYNSLSTCIKRAIATGNASSQLFLDKVTRSKRFYSSAYRVWFVTCDYYTNTDSSMSQCFFLPFSILLC